MPTKSESAKKTGTKASVKKTTAKAAAKTALKAPALPEKFTLTTMSSWLADAKGISKKEAREVLDTVFELVEKGVMNGHRVPVGNMGKAFVKVKPATKARMGRNPLTGESIKIPAKKATKVPKFTFGKSFKESALKAKIKD